MQGRNVLFASGLTVLIFVATWFAPAATRAATAEATVSKGQTVYVPAYSNLFIGPKKLTYQLATTLSIRNTDPSAPLQVTAIDYYDMNGKLVRRYLEKPLSLAPLASSYVHIEEKDVSGGFGANFIVRWKAERVINTPIIECVMIGATSGQGISFVSSGQELRE